MILAGSLFIFILSQPILRLLADKDVFTTPQIVYDVLSFVFTLALPLFVVLAWQYMKILYEFNGKWELRLLAVGLAIFVPGVIALAFINLFIPMRVVGPFATVLLITVIGATVLIMFSVLALLIHLELVDD